MRRTEKDEFIGELQQKLGDATAFYLTDFTGLNVKQMTQFRARLRKQGVDYVVVKNTLAQRALWGLDLPDVAGFFTGPTGVVISGDDAVAAAKALTDFAREFGDRPAVKGGIVEGREVTPEQVKKLADMPPREVLLAQIAGGLQAPMVRFASGMCEILAHTARIFSLLQEKREREAENDNPIRPLPFELTTGQASGPSLALAAPALMGTETSSAIRAEATSPQVAVTSPQVAQTTSPFVTTPQEIDAMIVEELNEVEAWTLGVALREPEGAEGSLRIGTRYTLSLALGPSGGLPADVAAAAGKRSRVSIRSTVVLMSQGVEFVGSTRDYELAARATEDGTLWRATTTVELSAGHPPQLPELGIVPRSAALAELNVLLLVANELYRDWVLRLRVTDEAA